MTTLNSQNFTDFKAELTVESPGRINLIGEHTDYNDGFVLPAAINKKITFLFRRNQEKSTCNIYSANYDVGFQVHLDDINRSDIEWENYILGVICELSKFSNKIEGFDCIIKSDLPIGAGVSSSAALECGLAYGLNALFDLQLDKELLIKISRDAEHNFVGTKCGIMDQFAVMMGKSKHVILLDCKTLDHSEIPVDFHPYKILLLNTNVSHNLASSEYNTRRRECEEGIRYIQIKYPEVQSLREVNLNMLEESKQNMTALIYQRCEYVIQENNRVLEAVEKTKENDLTGLGQLMYKSHRGLQHDYDVSCPELDFLVDFSEDKPYVLGSRMMGGGFGGCTINLIHQDHVEAYVEEVSKAYKYKFNIDLTPIVVLPCHGTALKRDLKK